MQNVPETSTRLMVCLNLGPDYSVQVVLDMFELLSEREVIQIPENQAHLVSNNNSICESKMLSKGGVFITQGIKRQILQGSYKFQHVIISSVIFGSSSSELLC